MEKVIRQVRMLPDGTVETTYLQGGPKQAKKPADKAVKKPSNKGG